MKGCYFDEKQKELCFDISGFVQSGHAVIVYSGSRSRSVSGN